MRYRSTDMVLTKSEIQKRIDGYDLDPSIFLQNDDISFSDLKVIPNGGMLDIAGSLRNFFINQEGMITYESWSQQGTANDIEIKLKSDINNDLMKGMSAYLFAGSLGSFKQNLILIAGDELKGTRVNNFKKLTKIGERYPIVKKDPGYKNRDLESISISYLQASNPLVIDAFTKTMFRYEDVAVMQPIKNVFAEAIPRISPDLDFVNGFEVPVYLNKRDRRLTVLGLESNLDSYDDLSDIAYLKFIQDGNYFKEKALSFKGYSITSDEKRNDVMVKYDEIEKAIGAKYQKISRELEKMVK